jgi:predicted phage baseplate assembly protein
VITEGTQVSTQPTGVEESYVLETMGDLMIPAGQTTGTVAAIEGETKRENLGSSTGLPAQFFELSFKPLSYSPDGTCSLEVYVTENGIEERWTLVPSLLDSKPSEKHFEIEIDENDIVTVNFGDNQNGKTPAPGANNVRAVYRVGGGAHGNVGANKINRMASNISEVSSVTNPLPAIGGVDRETVEGIKKMAPRMLRTLWRAVTAEDYKTLAEALPGVAKATVLCAPPGQAAYWGQVNLYIAPEGGGLPTLELKNMVEVYFADREMLNATTVVFDPVYAPVNVSLDVAVKENYMRLDIENAVRKVVRDFFMFPNVDFGQCVFTSDIVSSIDAIEGVRYVNLTVLSRDVTGVGNVIIAQNEIPQFGELNLDVFGGII